ncbi:MAG: PD-(D/E)XK nuclease family protein [Pseudomonadota bacterium]
MLSDALAAAVDSGRYALVVTSGRRLARAIERHVAQRALGAGAEAWPAMDVLPWRTWVRQLATACRLRPVAGQALPQLLSPAAARALWRQAARNALADSGQSQTQGFALAGLAANAYGLMRRYALAPDQVAAAAFDDDSRFLVTCVDEVLRRTAHNDWLLEADLPHVLAGAGPSLAAALTGHVLLAGFDELTPDQETLMNAMGAARFEPLSESAVFAAPRRVCCATFRDELIAAGRWARALRDAQPGTRVAIVVPGLAGIAEDVGRWFRQGFLPPAAGSVRLDEDRTGFEVSYGRTLDSYPAIDIAMRLLDFAHRPQSFTSLSRLLRSAVMTPREHTQPLLLEQKLRGHPDRPWQPGALADFAEALAPPWLDAIQRLSAESDRRQAPSAWAEMIAETLAAAGWLEAVATDSPVYQLRRAFHVALNALGPVAAATGSITLGDALAALKDLLAESLYQSEGEGAEVLVCGPLEMPGLGFDAVWIAGLDASRWPPVGRADPLLPRSLQRAHELPDATPEQTSRFWRRRFSALAAAAPDIVMSHAEREEDSELLPSPLLADLETRPAQDLADGALGWREIAGSLSVTAQPAALSAFDTARRLYRATTALTLIDSDPFAAIAIGRWHLDALEDPVRGIDPRLRGMIMHDALDALYASLDSQSAISQLDPESRRERIRETLARTMAGRFVHADPVLRALLRLEEGRAATLIEDLLVADAARPVFQVVAREQSRTFLVSGMAVHLRLDRVDRTEAGTLIIDYKTAARLSLNPVTVAEKHLQLVLYALTEREPPAGIALVGLNRDAHRYSALVDDDAGAIVPSGASIRRGDMAAHIAAWRDEVSARAIRFVTAPAAVARWPDLTDLNWLSRNAELVRNDH